jgi:predicted transcriptional regulator
LSVLELLWKVLTAKRWEVLKVMAGQGPLTIREVARRVERDVKAVHGDAHALIDAGLLERTEAKEKLSKIEVSLGFLEATGQRAA